MCGFSGELRFDGATPDVGAVYRMTGRMIARGPDAEGVWSAGPMAMGHRRLSVIDLSSCGDQPMHDAGLGLTLVFNGCIYNYQPLREELQAEGYEFFSTSDTEVVLKAYHAWGDGFVEKLQGMFAFVIYERGTGRTFLGRDRFGIKPLYVVDEPSRLRFASSLPALVAGGDIDTSIDPVSLHHYLTFHSVVPAPRTILNGVRKVPPATTIAIEADGSRTTTEFWRPDFTRDPDRADWSARDWEDATLEALRKAVQWRLVADVPVGVLLSGGLDSSLVVGLLAEAGQRDLNTFSIGFESFGGEEGDEFKYSDVIAERYGTNHHRLRIDTERMLPALGQAVHAMSEPMVSHDAVAFYLLSQEVSQHVKVVQSGQGADEVFAGYHWYPPMQALTDEVGEADRERLVAAAVDRYAQAFFDRPHAEMQRLVGRDYCLEDDVSRALVAQHFAMPGAQSATDMALRLDSQIMLVDDPVKRVDNMTMAWGLEARVPFLDHEVLEIAARIPPELKLAQEGKGVLKEAARRVIPNEVIDRPKGYFPVPALKYLQGPYLDLVRDALHAPEARERGLFQPDAVQHLLDDPNGQLTPLRGNKLWQLALLELWLQTHDVRP
ncbi:N-acetylglutaminylglutamine amidotransferase [Egicoccus halophilus]|uniref:asparagine synthase (glutamine-hydrolyzing) n=1 Tax=Egicoccus halophilus TaxID=1670830 RepID=A0A8J3ACG1_9ACTN|nr:N-acetylglutaminylglutamine amidotransferase [Egicoccus halophilus]GGI08432.1 asparagine synthetase B [Egicoccus halophilus]